jgi:hypothetical protein
MVMLSDRKKNVTVTSDDTVIGFERRKKDALNQTKHGVSISYKKYHGGPNNMIWMY